MWTCTEADWDRMLDETIAAGRCPEKPERLRGLPVGQYHCGLCGDMVLVGLPHGPVSDEMQAEARARLEGGETACE